VAMNPALRLPGGQPPRSERLSRQATNEDTAGFLPAE
jgi:hypothetical protein